MCNLSARLDSGAPFTKLWDMIGHIRRLIIPALLTCIGTTAMASEVRRVPYADLESILVGRIDFENFARALSPGASQDEILVFEGASLGERFAGQMLDQDQGFDTLTPAAFAPLSLRKGATGQNLAVEFIIFLSNQVKGLAPPGFPAEHAGGEGAISILFERDQFALGFRVASEPRPADPDAIPGQMLVSFLRRDGSVIDSLQIGLDWGLSGYGFRRLGDVSDIAGISITNRDPAGIAIDDVIFEIVEITS